MKFRIIISVIVLLCSTQVFASSTKIVGPWFTGPLFAPMGTVMAKGHYQIEPYLYGIQSYSSYNRNWNRVSEPNTNILNPELLVWLGLPCNMDVQFIMPYLIKSKQGKTAHHYGDTSVVLSYQAIKGTVNEGPPSLKLSIAERFPTGNYDNLNPTNLGVDSTGRGVFQTSLIAVLQKLWLLPNQKYLRNRFYIAYTIAQSGHFSGFHAHGGNQNFKSNIKPGNLFTTGFSFEYTLTQHWVPAIDFLFTHADATKLTESNILNINNLTTMGTPAGSNFSMAPAIEYNFNSHVGIITGLWFSLLGRNTQAFRSVVAAIVFNH